MAKTTIGIKNLSGVTLIISDLVDVSIAAATTVTVSDNNGYSKIKSSQKLYDSVDGDNAFIVIDGVEQDKANSLRYLQDNTVTGGLPSGGGADIPEIKGTSINWIEPTVNASTTGWNTLSTVIKATPFTVYGNVSSTAVILDCTTANAPGVLHMALYKYDYDADIWNIATEQLDASMVATGMIVQSFTTPQALTPGKYCVAWRCNLSGAMIRAFYKKASSLNFSGSDVSSTNWMNIMITDPITYNATMPTAVTFPPANFINSSYHENIQIKF